MQTTAVPGLQQTYVGPVVITPSVLLVPGVQPGLVGLQLIRGAFVLQLLNFVQCVIMLCTKEAGRCSML